MTKRSIIVLLMSTALVAIAAGPATASLSDDCDATGSFLGETYDAKDLPDVVEIEREMTVEYTGTHNEAPQGEVREYEGGEVGLSLPDVPGLPERIVLGSWGPGETANTSKTGTHTIDLDDRVPAGVLLPVDGFHNDSAGNCEGEGTVTIADEGPLDSLLKIIFLILTILFFLLFLYSLTSREVMA